MDKLAWRCDDDVACSGIFVMFYHPLLLVEENALDPHLSGNLPFPQELAGPSAVVTLSLPNAGLARLICALVSRDLLISKNF